LPAWKLIDCVTPNGGGDAKVNSNYIIAKQLRALEKTAFFLRGDAGALFV
jgi:hypothetical protein